MSPSITLRFLQRQADEQLAAAAAQGNQRAFEALVQRYRKQLLRYCRRFALPEQRAEDVVQQALMSAWLSLRRGADVKDVSAWLYRIVHNAAVDSRRASTAAPVQLMESVEDLPTARADLELTVAARETLASVAALPALQRDALLCTAVEGRTNEQTAEALGVSSGAIRGLVYRARVTVRAAATAIAPSPVLAWATAASRRVSGLAGRLSSQGATGAAQGEMSGAFLKGGVVMLTAGVLVAGGATVKHATGSGDHHARFRGSRTALIAPPQEWGRSAGGSPLSVRRLPRSLQTVAAAGGSDQGSGASRIRGSAGVPSGGRTPTATPPETAAGYDAPGPSSSGPPDATTQPNGSGAGGSNGSSPVSPDATVSGSSGGAGSNGAQPPQPPAGSAPTEGTGTTGSGAPVKEEERQGGSPGSTTGHETTEHEASTELAASGEPSKSDDGRVEPDGYPSPGAPSYGSAATTRD
jgi:RNA polymerase sigma factor (sigma-70 family)